MNIRLLALLCLFFFACKKYKDPAPFTDSRIKDKYCNIPSAINFNWNFPGVIDNSTCIFPADIFKGNYMYYDTILNDIGEYVSNDSFAIAITQLDSTKLTITGFCGADIYHATASRFFKFTLDSVLGNGQLYCNQKDTFTGNGYKIGIEDTNTIQFNIVLQTDTAAVIHKGFAIKK